MSKNKFQKKEINDRIKRDNDVNGATSEDISFQTKIFLVKNKKKESRGN